MEVLSVPILLEIFKHIQNHLKYYFPLKVCKYTIKKKLFLIFNKKNCSRGIMCVRKCYV